MKKYNVLELFAGAGGMALGFKQSGFNHLNMIENDKWAIETLNINFKKKYVPIDITTIKNFSEELNISNEVDVISGGFPCQSFSYAGMRKGIDDTRGTLFHDFARAISELKPKIFLAENVQGLIRHDNGKTLRIILNTFKSSGYEVVWKLLNANDYGVPQKRKRIFFVGIRNDIFLEKGSFEFPIEEKYKPVLKDVLIDVPESAGFKYNEKKYKVLKLVPPGGCWRDLPEDIAKEYMMKSYYLGGGKTGMARRLSMDEASLTLTTSPMQKQTERCHPEETRPLNVREYARIQTFPDNWIFAGSLNNQYKQIGNAVSVKLAKKIATQIKRYLNE